MYVETNLEGKKCAQNLVRSGVYWTRYLEGSCIGVGAGPADPVLAGSLFSDLIKFIIKKIARMLRACLLQSYHFKSSSYAPVLSVSVKFLHPEIFSMRIQR